MSKKQTQNHEIQERVDDRLQARRDAAARGAETRRRNREIALGPTASEAADQIIAQAQADGILDEDAPQQAEAPAPQVLPTPTLETPTGAHVAQKPVLLGGMATVAIRGDQAARLVRLAVEEGCSKAKLLIKLMDCWEEALARDERIEPDREIPDADGAL